MPLASEVRRPSLLPPRKGVFDSFLVLYAPLWHPQLSVSPFTSLNPGTQHSCTVTGATWGPTGRAFDGVDDLINPGRPASLLITGDLSILCWVKVNNLTANQIIIGQHSAAGYTGLYALMVRVTTGKIFFYRGNGVNAEVSVNGNVSLVAGTYYHLALTVSGVTVRSYVDAVLDMDGNHGAVTVTDAGTDIRIGYPKYLSEGLNGTLGEVWLYNRLLSIGEIQQTYQATKWRYI